MASADEVVASVLAGTAVRARDQTIEVAWISRGSAWQSREPCALSADFVARTRSGPLSIDLQLIALGVISQLHAASGFTARDPGSRHVRHQQGRCQRGGNATVALDRLAEFTRIVASRLLATTLARFRPAHFEPLVTEPSPRIHDRPPLRHEKRRSPSVRTTNFSCDGCANRASGVSGGSARTCVKEKGGIDAPFG